MRIGERVECTVTRQAIALGECLDGWADADALKDEDSICYRCQTGRRRRTLYATGFLKTSKHGYRPKKPRTKRSQ